MSHFLKSRIYISLLVLFLYRFCALFVYCRLNISRLRRLCGRCSGAISLSGVTLRVTPLRDCVTVWRGRGRGRTCKLPSSDSCYPEYLRRYTHGHVNHLSCRGPTIRIFIRTTKHQHNRSFSIVLLERLTT